MKSIDFVSKSSNEMLLRKLFNKVYSAIINEKIFCPSETAVVLAAHACHAKYGDINDVPYDLQIEELIPRRILNNHNLSNTEWLKKIQTWHRKLGYASFEDTIVEYLDIAQDLELYGASLFDVTMSCGSKKSISLDSNGLNIYKNKQFSHELQYLWSDVISFKARDKRLKVMIKSQFSEPIVFYVSSIMTAEILVKLYEGERELNSRKRLYKTTHLEENYYGKKYREVCKLRQLTESDLHEISNILDEIELELPKNSTYFEFAPWQIQEHRNQVECFNNLLSKYSPPTNLSLNLLRKCANIRTYLEQETFTKTDETLHNKSGRKFRGNFVICLSGRSNDFKKIDSDVVSAKNNNKFLPDIIIETEGVDFTIEDKVSNKTYQSSFQVLKKQPPTVHPKPRITKNWISLENFSTSGEDIHEIATETDNLHASNKQIYQEFDSDILFIENVNSWNVEAQNDNLNLKHDPDKIRTERGEETLIDIEFGNTANLPVNTNTWMVAEQTSHLISERDTHQVTTGMSKNPSITQIQPGITMKRVDLFESL